MIFSWIRLEAVCFNRQTLILYQLVDRLIVYFKLLNIGCNMNLLCKLEEVLYYHYDVMTQTLYIQIPRKICALLYIILNNITWHVLLQ